jgi:tagatose 1,6-diphosphate aldolase
VTGHMHSAQRARALDRLASPRGVITGAAVDHRDSLQAVLRKRGLDLDDAGITELKLRVASVLAPAATLILLDAEYAAAQAIAAGAIPGATGLVVPLEAMGYGDVARVAQTAFLEGWSPQKARRLGASGAKLLLPYRADVPDQAARQEDVVRTAVAGCREAGLALIVEPIVYRRDGEEAAGGGRFAELVAEGARRLAALEPDVLKLQYPGSAAACRALDDACGRAVPWVLLGGGASEDVIGGQIEDACRAGASGFIVGRTLFDAGLVVDPDESRRALLTRSRPLLERLAAIAERLAVPWRERVGALPQPPREWYREDTP